MKEGLIIEVDDRHPLAIVRLSGSLAAMEIYKVKAMADTWLREGKKFIALNLAYVSFMDSAGIGLLLQLRNSSHAAGGGVVLVRSATSQVMRTLEIASVEKLIPFLKVSGMRLGISKPNMVLVQVRLYLRTRRETSRRQSSSSASV